MANGIKNMLKKTLKSRRIFYVCRDAERAEAGLDLGLNNFFILAAKSPHADKLHHKLPKQVVIIPTEDDQKDTLDILKNPLTKKYIHKSDLIMVFKPTPQIESVCHENGWTLLNPPAGLSAKVEEKLSQTVWLGPLAKFLPKTETKILRDIKWQNKKFILQFNRAHTGGGTILIDSARKLNELKIKFPEREARTAEFVAGPAVTSNNIVIGKNILIGNISYQITGLAPFTDSQFATVGNDWALPHKILSPKQKNEYKKMVRAIGARLAKDGWRGLFGVDAIVSDKNKKVYLIEINARQPASTSFESILQKQTDPNGLTIFAAHILALLGKNTDLSLACIKSGAQIIQRVTEKFQTIHEPILARPVDWRHIRYENFKPNSDLLRMQSFRPVMEKHNILNEHGNELSIFASMARQNRIFNAPRAGMIVRRGDKILLIQRHRFNYDYWVVPGGTREDGELMEQTAIREMKEETGFDCLIDKNIPPIKFFAAKEEIYYFAEPTAGRAELGGPEKEKNNSQDHYTLKWVKISDIKKINLLPPILKEKLLRHPEFISGSKRRKMLKQVQHDKK